MGEQPFWAGLVDVPVAPGEAPLAPPVEGGALRLPDTDLPAVAARGSEDAPLPLALVLTGGAGQVAGPAARCARDAAVRLRRLEVTLRDPGDLAGNARRVVAAVDAARGEGALAEDVEVHVAAPDAWTPAGPAYGWLAAADELAAAELGLVLDAGAVPPAGLAALLDAALDRELPMTVAADGVTVLEGVLAAVALLFDGAPREEAVAALGSGGRDVALLRRGRRWVRAAVVQDAAAALVACRERDPGA